VFILETAVLFGVEWSIGRQL